MNMSQGARYGVAFIARASVGKSSAMQQSLRIGTIKGSVVLSGKQALGSSIRSTGMTSIRGFHSSRYQRQTEPSSAAASEASSSGDSSTIVSSVLQGPVDATMGTETVMQIGDLARHGLDTYLPTRIMEYALEYVHVTTGLPWWATIAAMVVGIRALLFPLAAYSQRHLVGVNRLKPEVTLITEKLQIASKNGDMMASAQLSQQMRSIYKRNGVSPFKGMLGGFSTIPFMMGMFFGIKDMALMPEITHMHTGGLWWFTDLTLSDPYYLLPALSTIGMMGVMELQTKLNTATEQNKNMVYGMRAMGVLMAFLTSGLPSGVFIFWITNNMISFAQVFLFHSKWFKSVMRIEDLDKVRFARKQESMLDKIDVKGMLGKQKKSSKFVVKHKQIN
ncbi:hypothetical protein H4R99_001538 [Coemansia sp. RSA 1722]|nr:hypothetical protein IWW45_000482 [Coemansia sp. RSA 485]KAJ2604854.1 hypothetical protein H4R99_001538 [Coemansia sp. RSA 1722]KAJ2635612.1 hypothetical protein GGF40_003504 [Coemansia sp. RSA 1286]